MSKRDSTGSQGVPDPIAVIVRTFIADNDVITTSVAKMSGVRPVRLGCWLVGRGDITARELARVLEAIGFTINRAVKLWTLKAKYNRNGLRLTYRRSSVSEYATMKAKRDKAMREIEEAAARAASPRASS